MLRAVGASEGGPCGARGARRAVCRVRGVRALRLGLLALRGRVRLPRTLSLGGPCMAGRLLCGLRGLRRQPRRRHFSFSCGWRFPCPGLSLLCICAFAARRRRQTTEVCPIRTIGLHVEQCLVCCLGACRGILRCELRSKAGCELCSKLRCHRVLTLRRGCLGSNLGREVIKPLRKSALRRDLSGKHLDLRVHRLKRSLVLDSLLFHIPPEALQLPVQRSHLWADLRQAILRQDHIVLHPGNPRGSGGKGSRVLVVPCDGLYLQLGRALCRFAPQGQHEVLQVKHPGRLGRAAEHGHGLDEAVNLHGNVRV
mmetsp:Transcript_9033/g.28170  ORF Transcript_9033/g.28170 Transcript_9033/m.28170 type:complete len:311 (+) Transcript_9033:383-1315(+)